MAGFVTRRHTRGIEFCLQGQGAAACQVTGLPFPHRFSPVLVRTPGRG